VDVCQGICRTAGFWGTHPPVSGALLGDSGGVNICGVHVADFSCAVEGLCVTPSKKQPNAKQLIAARQLLAAALSCYLSNGVADCSTDPDTAWAALFDSCNDACAATDIAALSACTPKIDCHNQGGQWSDLTGCSLGTCSGTTTQICGADAGACPVGETCLPYEGNCHSQDLVNAALGFNFEPPGPAELEQCQAANSSAETLFTCGTPVP
jgi:hypothetical protein